MPAAEEPQAGVCAEVLARSYPSPPVGLLKAPFRRCGAIRSRTSAQGASFSSRSSRFWSTPNFGHIAAPRELSRWATKRHQSPKRKAASRRPLASAPQL